MCLHSCCLASRQGFVPLLLMCELSFNLWTQNTYWANTRPSATNGSVSVNHPLCFKACTELWRFSALSQGEVHVWTSESLRIICGLCPWGVVDASYTQQMKNEKEKEMSPGQKAVVQLEDTREGVWRGDKRRHQCMCDLRSRINVTSCLCLLHPAARPLAWVIWRICCCCEHVGAESPPAENYYWCCCVLCLQAPSRQAMNFWLQQLQQKRWEYSSTRSCGQRDSWSSPTLACPPTGLVGKDNGRQTHTQVHTVWMYSVDGTLASLLCFIMSRHQLKVNTSIWWF